MKRAPVSRRAFLRDIHVSARAHLEGVKLHSKSLQSLKSLRSGLELQLTDTMRFYLLRTDRAWARARVRLNACACAFKRSPETRTLRAFDRRRT